MAYPGMHEPQPFRTYQKTWHRGAFRVYDRDGTRVIDRDWDDLCPGCETSDAIEDDQYVKAKGTCPCCGRDPYRDPRLVMDEYMLGWVGGGYTSCNIPPSPDGPFIIIKHPEGTPY